MRRRNKPRLKLETFQVGTLPKRGHGLRIAVTRRPPRGVPRDRWQKDGWFDVWLPVVAPRWELRSRIARCDPADPVQLRRALDAYEREVVRNTESRQTIYLLAELAKRIRISIGCFCSEERHCHRSRLKRLIERAAQGQLL